MMSFPHTPIQRSLLRTLLRVLGSVSLMSAGAFTAIEAQQEEFAAEDVVHLLQEPRHRTVHRDGGVFLLDVQVNPGDTSYPHTHNQPILLTYISDENGSRDGEVLARTEYVSKPMTHVVSNPGPGLLHIMAMVNDNPGVGDGFDDSPVGLAREPDIINPWFRSYRLELQPGEETRLQTHQNPTAIIQANSGVVHVTRPDGFIQELAKPGAWAWRKAGSAFTVRNVGSETSIVVINESRRRRN